MDRYFKLEYAMRGSAFVKLTANIPHHRPFVGFFENKYRAHRWIENFIMEQTDNLNNLNLEFQKLKSDPISYEG